MLSDLTGGGGCARRSFAVVPILFLILLGASGAQETSSALILSQSGVSLSGGANLTDVSLAGTAVSFLAGDQATGTITLQARGLTRSRVTLSLPNITTVDVHGLNSNGPDCIRLDRDGITNRIPTHNCMMDAAWFFPALSSAVAGTGDVHSEDLGEVKEDGLIVRHVRLWRSTTNGSPSAIAAFQRLSSADYYLDRLSLLPLFVRFNLHPDDDDSQNIPVEVRYADYRKVSGVAVPYRIQQLINGSLVLDITVTQVQLNTGLADALFDIE